MPSQDTQTKIDTGPATDALIALVRLLARQTAIEFAAAPPQLESTAATPLGEGLE